MTRNRGCSYREQIGPEADGHNVLSYLASRYRHSSPSEWSRRLRDGEIELDGLRADETMPLRAGATLVWHRPPWGEPDVPLHFDLLHEDAAIVAVNKPSGLPTMPAGGFLEHTLLTIVAEHYPGVTPLHRLGRFTSGIVLFARTRAATATLSRAWRQHLIEKHYLALGSGIASFDSIEIAAPIGLVPHAVLGSVYAASPHGKRSYSSARVLERRTDTTLFAVRIITGRPHQIRIHLAHAGHPLAGDPLYGAGGVPAPDTRALPGDGGYLLHAEKLCFAHPLTAASVDLYATPPGALRPT